MEKGKSSGFLALGGLFVLLILVPFFFRGYFQRHVAIMILMWSTIGVAWNMLAGYAGQTSLGHAVYFGIGAYTTGILFAKANITPWIGGILGAFFAAVMAGGLGFPLFRLSGFYFSIATIALGEIVWILFTNWDWVGGARGLFIPSVGDSWTFIQFSNKIPYYYIILSLFAITFLAAYFLSKSRAGYYFRAVRDEYEAAMSLGVDIRKYKTLAYAFSAFFTALAGAFYACYILYIDPDSVLMGKISIQICFFTILGGIGELWGPLAGAIALIPISEFARIHFSGGGRAVDLLIYGVLIVLFAIYQPHGVIGMFKKIHKWHRMRT